MYMTLKPIEAVREEELSSVAAPWCAISWLKSAHSGYCRIQGFNDLWEACILEQDSHHDHWNHRTHGFERLCAKINQGDWVVVLDKSWPPLAPAYAQVNGHWQPTRHICEPPLRRRMETQARTIQRAQREEKAFQSQNHTSSAEPQTEPASGPGNRLANLGPQAGQGEQGQEADGTIPSETVAARKKLSHDFYKEQGMPEHKIEAHMEGIDFSKPVERLKLGKGTIVEQHQTPNASQGNYYAQVGTDARQLGVSNVALDGKTDEIVARQPRRYLLNNDTEVLSSSSRAVEDTWSIPGKNIKTDGGGTQYFTMQRGNFTPA